MGNKVKTKSSWLHVDQGVQMGSDFKCWQGMVNLLPADLSTGGLVVVPKSHLKHAELMKDVNPKSKKSNFIGIPSSPYTEQLLLDNPPVLVSAPPGSIILWDSRLIHCNTCSQTNSSALEGSLLRIVAYTCFVPRPEGDDVKLRQVEMVQGLKTTNHWPTPDAMKVEHLAYPRHKSFKPLQSAAMDPEEIMQQYGYMIHGTPPPESNQL